MKKVQNLAHHIRKHSRKVSRAVTKRRRMIKEVCLLGLSFFIILAGVGTLWISTFELPDLEAFEQRKISESTKIYDRTGKILLYDVHQDVKRTLIPYEEISREVKNATVAIEDAEFYQHYGIKPTAIMRSVWVNLTTGGYSQGGSTITQQVIKNAVLTKDKTLTRKLKEWVLALKLERVMSKEAILGLYLNEAPYGGTIYGVQQASEEFFGKSASDVSLAEAAYLAALPQAPTYYSPFGNNKGKLDARKNLVLRRMLGLGFISQTEHDQAVRESVSFNPPSARGIKAPHFVFFIRDYLIEKYGQKAVAEEGLRVITTLDYELQQKGEQIVKSYALENEKQLDAENAALLAMDPRTGQILTMIGSRDYFDQEINGNFNVTLAHRQPGSSFKPFVYAEAFRRGYTPDTALFDLKTEFSNECDATSTPKFPEAKCYSPKNYDGLFRGLISLRNALAQSINVPAVKLLYLVGVRNALDLAKDMGIVSLGNADQYGLTLVLGGGEVSLLEITGAYSVFATGGLKNPPVGILRVEDRDGHVLEEFTKQETRVLEEQAALTVTDILSDNKARAPSYGTASSLYFPGRDVAAKTGTTNDVKDTWIIGYTPSIAVGAWAGNNDGRPVQKERTARLVIAPMWNAFMQEALRKLPREDFQSPAPIDTSSLKPVLKGNWRGGKTYVVDKVSGKLATEFTPIEQREEKVVQEVHSILHWLDKNDINGPIPTLPDREPQYSAWEYPIRQWALQNGFLDQTEDVVPKALDDIHRPEFAPSATFLSPDSQQLYSREFVLPINLNYSSKYPVIRVDFYLNNSYLGSSEQAPFSYQIKPNETEIIEKVNSLRAVMVDSVGNKGQVETSFTLQEAGY